MKSSDYWRKRTMQVEDTLHNKGVEYYRQLEEQYRQASKKTQEEVSVLYSRLAKNNNISLNEAKKLLTTRELEEFRWSVDEYIAYGKENALNGAWMKQLENASLRYRISRLEAMKIQMQHHAEVLYAKEADGMTKLLTNTYTEGYYRTAHMVQTGLGVGHSFAEIDDNQVEKVIGKPWAPDGKNFSERVWGQHRPQLVNDLHSGLTQSIIRGDAPDKLIEDISKKYDVASSKAGNLVMTESAYFGNLSQQDCYDELEVEMQQFCATLDTHTSDICRSMDLKIFPSSDVKIGLNAPPLHCRCRSVMTPYFEDFAPDERIARDKDGNNIYVPADMSYEDWYKQYIEGTEADKKKKKRKKKEPESKEVEPTTLKEKVENIKADLKVKEQTLDNKKTEVKAKKAELSVTQMDVHKLEIEQIDLNGKKARFDSLKDSDLDSKFENIRNELDVEQKKYDELNEQYIRYYERPERGTPEYDKWREWRDSLDGNQMIDDFYYQQDKVRDVKTRLQITENDKSFVDSINIDELNEKIAKVDEKLIDKRNSKAMLTDDITHLTDDIADTRKGIEENYQRAGKEFIAELEKTEGLIGDDDLKKLREEASDKFKEYLSEDDSVKKFKIYDEYQELNNKYTELSNRQIPENAEKVKGIVSQVRSVGASDVDDLKKVHLGNSKSDVLPHVMNAYSHYPTDWVDASSAFGKLSLKKVKRGYYAHHNKTIAISGYGDNGMFKTSIHELGHRFERVLDDLLEIEATFYNRRTKGEKLHWLGRGYSRDEKSRFDDFLEKYMGKDYAGTAYELVSMGFELAYTNPLKLMEDRDMAELIFGLLLMK